MPSAPTERRLILLGATGSIGRSTLDVVRHLNASARHRFRVVGMAAGRNASELAAVASEFRCDAVALAGEGPAEWPTPAPSERFHGPDAALELVERVARPGDLVMAAMVGFAGLAPTLRAIEKGCTIALANKETLVAAGSLVNEALARHRTRLIPVDSEHSAITQCLQDAGARAIRRIVLTASGGPFRTWPIERMRSAPPEEALRHPTWSMGAKNTIDSATMMNKALEVIEAHWLFGLPAERIEAIIHPQSIVHGFVEFDDCSVLAQLSPPDMRLPIQYALTWPERVEGRTAALDFDALRSLVFEPVDGERFPAIELAHRVVRDGGSSGAIFNAANEEAVAAYLRREIPFGSISTLVRAALDSLPAEPVRTFEQVSAADAASRAFVRERARDRTTEGATAWRR
ncbi:MAG: 1-deoxy-D-xylulose-5-phosphate reductoisomerase [Phycisphaerae bacterium]|nr:1-deoxy-D-xylulose-5-phosphate reductoisomerase [Phycisphaerae bacterium]